MNRPANSSPRFGANGTSRPSTVAAVTDSDMARTRPIRSAISDHGMTPIARPAVAADTMSAAFAAPMWRSAAMSGSTACGEYSWAKVATPAQNSAASSRRYSAEPRGCPFQAEDTCGASIVTNRVSSDPLLVSNA